MSELDIKINTAIRVSEHGKRLGIYEPPAPVPQPKPAVKKAESAPVAVDGAAPGEKKQLSERDKKILESIKTIETMLNDLKTLVKQCNR